MIQMLEQRPQVLLAELMRRLYLTELNTSKGGNVSIRCAQGRWCTPSGLDKSAMAPEDMLFFREDGTVVGRHDVSIETAIHMNILDHCPDSNAVIHVHDLPLIAFSVMHKAPDTTLYPTRLMGQSIPVTPFEIPGSQALADGLVYALKSSGAPMAILANHGAFVSGENMFRALERLEAADFLCRSEQAAGTIAVRPMPLNARSLIKGYAGDAMPTYEAAPPDDRETAVLAQMAALHARAYHRRLFAVNSGLIAVRLGGNDFAMPLDDCDRLHLTAGDFSIVRGGKLPQGMKQPILARFLCEIFAAYPQINAVSVAQPAMAMAFAITDEALDSRVLPESYSKLRRLRRLPFGSFARGAQAFDPARGYVFIVENECIVSLCGGAFEAFECCELMEEYARIQISARQMGLCTIPLTDAQLEQVLLEESRKAQTDLMRFAKREYA